VIIFLFLVLFLQTASVLSAQEPDTGLLEAFSETIGADVWERLEDLRTDPILINRASVEDLLHLPWLDHVLAGRIIDLREKRGRFKNLVELLDVPGMSESIFREISPFLKMGREMKMMARLGTRRKPNGGDMKLRLSSSGNGFRSGLKVVRYSGEGGSALGGYLRLEIPFSGDASVTIGNYYLRLGQGLTSWSAFGNLRSPLKPIVYPLSGSGVRGTTGTAGGKMLRGFAADFSRGNTMVAFARGTMGGGNSASVVEAFTLAVSGGNGVRLEGSVLALEEHDRFAEGVLVFDTGPGRWFAGSAWRSGGGAGVISGVERKAGNTSVLMVYRRFSSEYHSPLAFDMSEGSTGAGNLEALYTGLVIGRGGALVLALYRDVGRRVYRGNGLNRVRFDEFSALFKIKPARRVTLSVSLKGEEEENGSGSSLGRWGRLRMDLAFRPGPGLQVRSRIETSIGDGASGSWRASLMYLEARGKLPGGLDVRGRFTFYNCEQGGFLYVVEGGLPERSVIQRLSGEGERYQFGVTKRIGKGWTARSKLSGALRRGTVYAAGFDHECWKAVLTWECQLELRF
jgi:hypothetical protein